MMNITTKLLATLVTISGLAACEPEPKPIGRVMDQGDLASQAVLALESGLNGDRGRDFGVGVTLRDVRANGRVAEIDIGIPLPSSALVGQTRADFIRAGRGQLVQGMCNGNGSMQLFFGTGAELEVRMVGSDNVVIDSNRYDRCP